MTMLSAGGYLRELSLVVRTRKNLLMEVWCGSKNSTRRRRQSHIQRRGTSDCPVSPYGIVGVLGYATFHGFTSGMYSLLLLCRRWMGGIATITDR